LEFQLDAKDVLIRYETGRCARIFSTTACNSSLIALGNCTEPMMPSTPFIFVSYARRDMEPVGRVLDALRRVAELRGQEIRIWTDTRQLSAGENWASLIQSAMEQSNVFLTFISPNSVQSEFVVREMHAAYYSGRQLLPVLLRPTPTEQWPPFLRDIQYVDMSRLPAETASDEAASEIVRIIGRMNLSSAKPIPTQETTEVAEARAEQVRDRGVSKEDANNPPDSIFLVHGHDEAFLRDVENFINGLGVRPIIMKDVGGASTSLIDKFFEIGGDARYAIVLLSGDDMGVSRDQYEEDGVGERALQYRSRQNVILELGYFYGLLGWENVFVLERIPPRKFPNFERPSDLNGVLFDRYDEGGKWRRELHRRLSDAGFEIPSLSELSTKTS
jgi:predicted nucleotide-binding protein